MNNIILSVIIPVRANDNYDISERIGYKLLDNEIGNNIEFIVVDDGSDNNNADKIKKICLNMNMMYVYIESKDKYFSLARARNKGVQCSHGKYILIEDVDFAPYKGYYNDIIDEIELFDLEHNQEEFFTIPGIWLSEKASIDFLNDNTKKNAKKMIQKYLEYDINYFQHGVPTGSVLVMSRHHYLSIGGQNELFNRWGFEDHEFAERLLSFSNKFPDPVNKTKYIDKLYIDYTDYEGFRARYRLHGDLVGAQGIYNFHIYHPISNTFRNEKIKKENRELFNRCVEKLSENNYYLPSLSNPYRGRTCVTSKNPFIYNNELFPLYGDVFLFDDALHTKEEFYEFICDNKIDRVIMQNPYSDEKKIDIYKYLKEKNVECIIGERGALPESVYFDNTGFCCESK